MSQLLGQIGLGSEIFTTAFLIFVRIGSAMSLLPVVGERSVPQRVRLSIALIYTTVVFGALFPDIGPIPTTPSAFTLGVAAEVIIGLAMGFGLRVFVLALQTASSMVAQSTSLSQIFGNAAIEPQPAIGHLLLVAGLALAVTHGLHVQIARFLIGTFHVFPLAGHLSSVDLSNWGLAQISFAFGLAFSIAAPFLIASLIYNIALGAINKAMPQLMVSFVGAPAVTAGGLFLLFICAPLMLSVWQTALTGFFDDPYRVNP